MTRMNARHFVPSKPCPRGRANPRRIIVFGKPWLIAMWLAAAVTLLAFIGGTAAASSAALYKSQIFNPAFSVVLQPGWTVAERDVGAAQIYKNCSDCVHQGEENGEVTLDMALSGSTPKSAIKRLRGTPGLVPGPVNSFSIGTLRGWAFMARRGNLPIAFPQSGYRTDPSGSPLQIIAVRARGKTVTIFIDPHEATPAQTPRFMKNAAALLRGLRFR